jgi:uncharacterized membrane protein
MRNQVRLCSVDADKKMTKEIVMKTAAIVGVVLSALLSAAAPTLVLARGSHGGGLGMHSTTGGAFGTNPSAPGTNSAGTALSSSGFGGTGAGPALGTGDPATDREDRKAARMVESICKGC